MVCDVITSQCSVTPLNNVILQELAWGLTQVTSFLVNFNRGCKSSLWYDHTTILPIGGRMQGDAIMQLACRDMQANVTNEMPWISHWDSKISVNNSCYCWHTKWGPNGSVFWIGFGLDKVALNKKITVVDATPQSELAYNMFTIQWGGWKVRIFCLRMGDLGVANYHN